jgi:hypothetical protein
MSLNAAANASANRSPAVGLINGQDNVPDAHWQIIITNKDGNGNFYMGQGREGLPLCTSTALLDLTCPARISTPGSKHNFEIFFRRLGLGHIEQRS